MDSATLESLKILHMVFHLYFVAHAQTQKKARQIAEPFVIITCLRFWREVAFASAAEWAAPIVWDISKSSASSDAVIWIASADRKHNHKDRKHISA